MIPSRLFSNCPTWNSTDAASLSAGVPSPTALTRSVRVAYDRTSSARLRSSSSTSEAETDDVVSTRERTSSRTARSASVMLDSVKRISGARQPTRNSTTDRSRWGRRLRPVITSIERSIGGDIVRLKLHHPSVVRSYHQEMARILIVDDDPDIVKMVVRRLQHANHKAHGVTTRPEAIAFVAEQGSPDVVVLDVDMPDGSGLELLGMLREQTGSDDLPAIFLSSRMRPEDIAAGRELDAVYLTKPFVGNALLSAVENVLDAHAKRHASDDDW